MKSNKRHVTVRERRERAKRMMSLTHLLLAVVALIECLLLLSVTTYSWIESSSSLIISSGSLGSDKMAIASNLHYKVALSYTSSGNAMLSKRYDDEGNETEHGFYRELQNFSYARTSSPDGKTFYFPKTSQSAITDASSNVIGYSYANSDIYRQGDTADFNTTYSYIDFTLTNSTESTKKFYFGSENLFSVSGATTEISNIIKNAMRISVEQENTVNGSNHNGPYIYSIDGSCNGGAAGTDPTFAISSTGSESTPAATTSVTTKKISNAIFANRAEDNCAPVFISDYDTADNRDSDGNVVDRISVRIWFESRDPFYLRATTGDNASAKASVDSAILAASVNVNFSMLFDNVEYDQIYFDDYTFSNTVVTDEEGNRIERHITEENPSYGMYLHVYNSSEEIFVNYPMTTTETDSGALRWVTSVPLDHVVNTYLTNNNGTNGTTVTVSAVTYNTYDEAYFFYGSADFRRAPATVAYKWKLQAPMTVALENEASVAINSGDVTRALGAVRSLSTTANGSTVIGYSQCDTGSDPMRLVSLRDRTTGFTGLDYNMASDSVANTGYIESSVRTQIENRKIFRYRIPANAEFITINNGYPNRENTTGTIPPYNTAASREEWLYDGICLYVNGNTSNEFANQMYMKDSGVAVTLPKSDDPNYKYIYFYFYNCWDDEYTEPHLHWWTSSDGDDGSDNQRVGFEMDYYTTVTASTNYSGVYVNTIADANANEADITATEKQAIGAANSILMYYDDSDSANKVFKAYVPASPIRACTYITAVSATMTTDMISYASIPAPPQAITPAPCTRLWVIPTMP